MPTTSGPAKAANGIGSRFDASPDGDQRRSRTRFWRSETLDCGVKDMRAPPILVERTIERQRLWKRLKPEDFLGVTPLFYGHINPYGWFDLDLERPSF